MIDKKKIIIDTDPGIDDAIAIALAAFSDEVDVKLVTTVSGNVNIDYVTENVLKLLSFYKKDLPVAKGASTPLVREAIDASNVHGKTGLEGYDFKEINESLLIDEHAVTAMYKVIKENPGEVSIVAIGPLTNIALLLRLYPDVEKDIKEIVLMGGSPDRGNFGVYAEFNIGYDPEAAKVVFNSSIPRTMVGMNIGTKALIKPEVSEKVQTLNKIGDMFYSLFKKYRGGSFNTGLKMYDATAVAYLLRPDMFETVETFVGIETHGEYSYGATAVDLRGYLKKEANTTVCMDIDEVEFEKWFINEISKFNIEES